MSTEDKFALPRRISRFTLILVEVSLLLALILALDLQPFLRGGLGWQWSYEPAPLARAVPLIVGTGVYLVGAWLLVKRTRRAAPVLIWSAIGVVALSLAVLLLRADDVLYELFARTVSGLVTGPHLAGAQVDWAGGEWRDWPAVMRAIFQQSGHVALSPPGLPMWYGLLNALLGAAPGVAELLHRSLLPYQCHNFMLLAYSSAEWASAWFGILMPLWASLAVLPLYGVARRLGGMESARRAVMMWPLVPALVMFGGTWNTLYPLLSLTTFWLLLVGLDRPCGAAWFAASGLLMGLMSFANFSLVPLVGLLGFYTLLYYLWNERRTAAPPPWTRPLLVGLWFGAALSVPWIIHALAGGSSPFDILRTAFGWHLALDRPYLPWLWMHSWEWLLMTGIPPGVVWLMGAWRRLRRWRESGPVLGAALLLAMVVLILSGTARGETGRVWLFFSPFVLIAAAGEADHREGEVGDNGNTDLSGALMNLSQAALMIALAVSWPVIGLGDSITPPPQPPGGAEVSQPADAVFAESFRLVGWDARVGDQRVVLTLNWQADATMTTPYWFSALLVAPNGAPLLEAVVWQPLATRYPTTCWRPGEQVGDTVTLPLPSDAAPGEWWISLAAFADPNDALDRLPVRLPDGATDTQVGLGPVTVPDR